MPGFPTTYSLTNVEYFPMVIDYVCVKSNSANPVWLQVMGPGLIISGNDVLVGEYPFFPKSNLEGSPFTVCQPISIVILPGDTVRGISPSNATYSITVNGHYVFPTFYFPN